MGLNGIEEREIAEDWRAVIGEFFFAVTVPNAVSFTGMRRECLKPPLG